jgi:hypothetical protein
MSDVKWIKFSERHPESADLPIWAGVGDITDIFFYSVPGADNCYTHWAKADIPSIPETATDYALAYGELKGILTNLANATDSMLGDDWIVQTAKQTVARARELGHI